MKKGQVSVRGGIQDFLCPFTDMCITQGSGVGTHKGTKANDVRGLKKGVKYPYYAPCDLKLIWKDAANGECMWQSVAKVRFSNNVVNYATILTCHDSKPLKSVGTKIKQGALLGYMGNKAGNGGQSFGVHCHIEISQNKYTIKNWHKNKYGIWCFPKETEPNECYFIDNTKIINGNGKKWKTTKDIQVNKAIKKGDKVKFNGTFLVDKIDIKNNLFCNYSLIGGKPTKPYHWLPSTPFDNITGKEIIKPLDKVRNKHTYIVQAIDKPTASARLLINGRTVWIKYKYLKKV